MTSEPRALATRSVAPVAMRTDNLDTLTVAKMLAESGFFGEVRQAGQALAKMLAGQELGMGPIASLMGVYYQQGKVSYSANIMAAAIKRSGIYTYRIRLHDATICDIEFFERGDSLGHSVFTIEEARQANLLSSGQNKGNWEKYPRNMLFSRAMSNGCKWFTPDIFGGATPYTPDEISDNVIVSDDGEMRPVITDVPIAAAPVQGVVVNDIPVWVSTYHQQWAKGAAKANQIEAEIPEKPDPSTASKDACQAALRQLAINIKARERDALEAQLREVVGIANDAAGTEWFEIPVDLDEKTDDEVREMIAGAQAVIPTETAA